LIGEAPGEKEDLEGRSFVGRSGKLLDKIFASIGLSTDGDVYITNSVKCRPPENRKPLPDEVKTCAPFLETQFRIVGPRVVVLLGATAHARMAPGRVFAEDVGRFFDLDIEGKKTPFLTLFHPSYLLYSPKRKIDMLRDMIALRRFLVDRGHLAPSAPEPSVDAKIPF
jgi:DNA polymerase